MVSSRLSVALTLTFLAAATHAGEHDLTFTTLAGAPASFTAAPPLDHPHDMVIDAEGTIYITDSFNDVIRKLSPSGELTVVAGTMGKSRSVDGTGTAAQFADPQGIAIDRAGNLYVTDVSSNTIRKISPTVEVTTIAGSANESGSADGPGSTARFFGPGRVAVDFSGNLYVADSYNHTIRKITPAGVVSTIAGSAGQEGRADGKGSAARFDFPDGLDVDAAGTIYVADALNDAIRKITPSGQVTTLAGGGTDGSSDGHGSAAHFDLPRDVAVDASGVIYVADESSAE